MSTELSIKERNKWARRIAAEVEPERKALAPMMMEAYLRGGRERKQLFENKPALGGILDGGVSLLPFAYLALSTVAAGLIKLYQKGGLRLLSDLLSGWKTWLEIVKARKTAAKEADAPPEPAAALLSLRRTLDEVQRTLEKQGLPPEQCELVSYRVMKALLQEPVEAAQLVRTFQEKMA